MVKTLALLMKGDQYGTRIVENLCSRGFSGSLWGLHEFEEVPPLDVVLDEPEAVLPRGLPDCDLVLSLGLPQELQALVPTVAEEVGAKGVIIAICNQDWLPPGLRGQVKDELEEKGISYAFPKPFCSLTETGDPVIDEFARSFGKPELEVKVRDGIIRSAKVLRGAPCGSTWYVAEKLVGLPVEPREALWEEIAKAHHVYPCLGSMVVDPELGDTVLHVAQYLLREAMEKALEKEGF